MVPAGRFSPQGFGVGIHLHCCVENPGCCLSIWWSSPVALWFRDLLHAVPATEWTDLAGLLHWARGVDQAIGPPQGHSSYHRPRVVDPTSCWTQQGATATGDYAGPWPQQEEGGGNLVPPVWTGLQGDAWKASWGSTMVSWWQRSWLCGLWWRGRGVLGWWWRLWRVSLLRRWWRLGWTARWWCELLWQRRLWLWSCILWEWRCRGPDSFRCGWLWWSLCGLHRRQASIQRAQASKRLPSHRCSLRSQCWQPHSWTCLSDFSADASSQRQEGWFRKRKRRKRQAERKRQ